MRDSFESGRPDSAMVPSVCCSLRDETAMHLAHLPVHRILWRTGSDKGEERRLSWRDNSQTLPFVSSLSSFPISSTTSWTISHHPAMKVRCQYVFPPCVLFRFILLFLSLLLVLLTFPPGNLISHIFRENEVCRDAEWERYFCYKNIEVPEIYSGPHLTFPLTVEQTIGLVEAFRNKKVCTHQRGPPIARRSQSKTFQM